MVVSGANVSSVNFTAAPQAFSITGTITPSSNGAGATVTLSGTASGTTVADASGNYVFNALPNGSYSVTPTKSGVTFSPVSQTVSVSGANVSSVNFSAALQTFSIWPSSATPATVSDSDASAVELGVKFRANVNGFVTGIRFYKGTANTGTHIGNLWTSSGVRLATATFTNETASGWQQVIFSTPVAITANTTYVASYHTNVGHYAANNGYFASAGVTNGPLTALANGVDGSNGVYQYGATSAFPNQTWQSTNYWVDLIFTISSGGAVDTIAPTVTGRTPASGATGVAVGTTVSATFSEALAANTVTTSQFSLQGPGTTLVPATVSYNSTTFTATLTPSSPLASNTLYTAAVLGGTNGVKDSAGNALAATSSWSFTTAAAQTFSITGTISPATIGSGATVTLSGSASATTVADASGNYVFNTLPNGSYSVTPTKSGVSFSPASQSVSVSGANVGSVNFTATPQAFSITGTITPSCQRRWGDGYALGDRECNNRCGCLGQLRLQRIAQRIVFSHAGKVWRQFQPSKPNGQRERCKCR